MLERLRSSGGGESGASQLELARWTEEWRRTAPTLELELRGDPGELTVQGEAQRWRAALWVALDNARQAGAGRVDVIARAAEDHVEVRVEDDGCGLSVESAARAGEPFQTGWGGTGLGLFVSRQAARVVGGDVALEPLVSGGACTRITIPKVSA